MFLLLLSSILFARHVEIIPQGAIEFHAMVAIDEIYKIKSSTADDIEVSFIDPKNGFIFTETSRSATLFANLSSNGKIKAVVRNKSKIAIDFSYNSPDPRKELLGHLGLIKDVDIVSDLARVLDHSTSEQSKQVARTFEHQKMVASSRFWARVLMVSELVLTALGF